MFQTIYYSFLFIFNTGYLFALEHHDCGGTIDIRQEKNGCIRYSSLAGQVDSNNVTFKRPGHSDTECIWVIDALRTQKVQLEVISIDNVSRVWVHFESNGEQRDYALEESSPVSAMGRIIITWRAKKYANSLQSINLSFTADWKDIGNSFESQKGKSAQTEPAILLGTSSPSISAAPRVRRKSWLLGSSEPALGSKGSTHHPTGLGGQGLGHGTVGAFHSLTSASAHWLSPDASAASDKEVPPLPQETSDNNPDTSGAALAEAKVQGVDAVALQRSEIRAEETKPEPPRFPGTPTDSPGLATTTVPPTQGLDSIFPGLLNVRVPRTAAAPLSHTDADSSMPLSQINTLLPTLPPHGTAPVPPSLAPDQQAERSGDTPSHTDTTSGSPQSSVASLSLSSISQLSGEVEAHSLVSTVVNSPPDLTLPDSRNPPVAYVSTAHTGVPRGKDYIHSYYQPSFISPFPGTGGQEVTERQSAFDSLSDSTLGLSQGRHAFPESEGTMGRDSWSVTDLVPPASSLPEDTTGTQQALKANGSTEMIPGSTEAEGNLRISPLVTRSLSEDKRSDVPGVLEDISALSASTVGPSGTASPSLDSSTMEEVAVSVPSVDPGSSLGQVPSISPPVGADTEKQVSTVVLGSSDPYTATPVPELGEKAETDFTVSVPFTEAPTHSSVSADRDFTEMVTEKPELKDSASTHNDHVNPASATAVSEVSLGPECETNPAHESQSSNCASHPHVPVEADGTGPVPAVSTASTAPTPAGPRQEPTVSEDLSSAPPIHSTPDHSLTGVTTATLLLTTSFAENTQGRRRPRGTKSPEETVPHSRRGHSESTATSADGSTFHSHTVTPGPVDSNTSQSAEPGSPTLTPPLAASSTAGSSTVASSVCSLPACSSVPPHTPEGLSPSIQVGTEGPRKAGCPSCTAIPSTAGGKSSPPVTFSPTVTATTRLTSSSPSSSPSGKTTATPFPFIPRPRPTSQTAGQETVPPPPSPRTDQSTSTLSTQPANSRSPSSSAKPVRGRVFIVENQPAIIKEETVQLLLQMVLESGSPGEQKSPQPESIKEDVVNKVEPLLQKAPGYEGLRVSWTSGNAVVQGVPVFNTARALSWLGAPGGLLDVTGLRENVRRGLYVGGAKVANITVGGLQPELCSWLFLCPSGFQCVPTSLGNASCTSLCHTDYCKNSGICTHHHGQQPMCQCPVGEDFWYMGRWCDFRMTRQRLVGVCLGVLFTVAVLMATLSYLIIRRFKAMLIQAKVDQTRSSYRRFNHFDELSSRFWLRSWPGSADSLENPAYSRSDELLHLRALDRTCCYHDDTLSIASTYPGSGTHVNTVYAHGSHYNWDLSDGSINEWIADSGKASDLSVCSWPIEPIQWTPFPLLQQLGIHRAAKTPRPHSYCEGMELVDMEKTRTA
ncbi:mucin-19 [Anguilla rostrata]|uniref:mucin-19 n=1 Tax=Anguilla rostrata TaxID=7938 RepID=UPI0030D2F210